jgi:hypothetical protein
MRRLVRLLLEERAMNLSNLKAAGVELTKLADETERDAAKLIGEVQAARSHKNATFARAPAKIAEIREGVTDFGKAIDALDAAIGDNGDPTSGELETASGSSQEEAPADGEPQSSWAGEQK